MSMEIKEIANNINEKAKEYTMGNFPSIRKKLHNLNRNPPSNIFTLQTIFDDYAFHYGGRKELQYNIGYFMDKKGNELFRYGIALSLERSRTLPDYRVLDKKFSKFNEFIKTNKEKLSEYILFFVDDELEAMYNLIPVNNGLKDELFREGVFIFLGKSVPFDKIDYNEVLSTFDDLLDAYKFVEGNEELVEIDTTTDGKFKFEPKFSERVEKSLRLPPANKVEVELRHNQIQGKIRRLLIERYGIKSVGEEINTGFGTSIDIVVKNDSEIIFYEIKTASSLRLCLREAIGQLLEYAYWSKKTKPSKLVIISENPISDEANNYLQTLRDDLYLNVYYQQFDIINNRLSREY
jgi:hypothetical protein